MNRTEMGWVGRYGGVKKYYAMNKRLDKNQFLVPYLMSSHPGSTLDDAIKLAEYIRDMGYIPQQVQDFYPTPATISTCMYYTGLDPRTMKKVYVTSSPHEKAIQRALVQYKRPENYDLVKEALIKCGRNDLIGFSKECLIPPRKINHDVKKNDRKNGGVNKSGNDKKNNTGRNNKTVNKNNSSNNRNSKKNNKTKKNGKRY